MSGRERLKARSRSRGRAKRVLERPPMFVGWRSTDEEEIERRRWRGRAELVSIEALEPDTEFYGSFRVQSESGGTYEVEIRSLEGFENSCDCVDHSVNGLGTCKHIEGVLIALRHRQARRFDRAAREGSPRAEVYLRRYDDPLVRISWPTDDAAAEGLRHLLGAFFAADGSLSGDPLFAVEALAGAVSALPDALRARVRISRHLAPWIDEQKRRKARNDERQLCLVEAEQGKIQLEALRHPLLPYQREGMLHLAFGERALLADEMGLGKTVQAIAACDLLRRRRGIERVLVISPASLKGEWQDQIARFTDLSTQIVSGSRAQRLWQYKKPAFFNLANYEQILSDAPDINALLAPDVIILDEAQRIKNWQAKTARAVKRLKSPYAFVLTGTPLENRIDELYSIVQYLDPGLLGPLFRFNRLFYELDNRGRPTDYQNLEELHRRLHSVMLRRRKSDVEDQLPGRTETNYFVEMTGEQRLRYEDFERKAARLIAEAQRRPLTKDEFDQLQLLLACMRMTCDTPYILDPDCRICPKLEELERVLSDVLAEPDCKVIIFSEWIRMLELVQELAREMNVDFALHTGSVPQVKRRAEIRRFKQDPSCRLFLSSDSGSVGLNLQAATVVINMDLPWNPAKLEQRIARAWRKHQTRSVSVVNLVTENSIEHRMLSLIAQKQELADGVLDGRGDLGALQMPSGKAAFLERLEAMMKAPPAPIVEAAPSEQLRDDLLARHGERLLLLESSRDEAGRETVLAVLEGEPEAAPQEAAHLAGEHAGRKDGQADEAPHIEVLDAATFATLRRLAEAGLIQFTGKESERLHCAPGFDPLASDRRRRRLAQARTGLAEARRKLRMASLLAGGGFKAEARAPLSEAVAGALDSLALLDGEDGPAAEASARERADALLARGLLSPGAAAAATSLETRAGAAADGPLDAEMEAAEQLLAEAEAKLEAPQDDSLARPPAEAAIPDAPASSIAAE